MALTHNGTKVNVPSAYLPGGYIKPEVDEFLDYENQYRSRVFTILKSTVEDPVSSVTFSNLMDQLNTDIIALLNADINTAALTVTSYAELNSVSTNNNLVNVLYTDGVLSYVLVVNIYVKTA